MLPKFAIGHRIAQSNAAAISSNEMLSFTISSCFAAATLRLVVAVNITATIVPPTGSICESGFRELSKRFKAMRRTARPRHPT
jgi:hypothetical protein